MAAAVAPLQHGTFLDGLYTAPRRVLLLDYDGTVAPFSVDRERAYPYPTVPELLDCIMTTCRTRVALISGRAAHDIPPLLGLNPCPEIWGAHGLERLHPDGRYEVAHISEPARHALAEAAAWIAEVGLQGVTETKPGAVAVHWRGLPPAEAQEARAAANRVLTPLTTGTGLMLTEFEQGLELRVRARDKCDAVRTILAEVGPAAPVAYLGDDASDEEAFRALNGRGLTVLVRPTYRFTAAQIWLRPPTELVQFLSDWVRTCGGDM